MGKHSMLATRKAKSNRLLEYVMNKFRKGISVSWRRTRHGNDEGDFDDSVEVPEDVKEGHFAVFASDNNGETRRFVVPLGYLNHPGFVRLLEQAEEEFGFNQVGALFIPCKPSRLEQILEKKPKEDGGVGGHGLDISRSVSVFKESCWGPQRGYTNYNNAEHGGLISV